MKAMEQAFIPIIEANRKGVPEKRADISPVG
jgi:hypothetical protein